MFVVMKKLDKQEKLARMLTAPLLFLDVCLQDQNPVCCWALRGRARTCLSTLKQDVMSQGPNGCLQVSRFLKSSHANATG